MPTLTSTESILKCVVKANYLFDIIVGEHYAEDFRHQGSHCFTR